MSDNKTIAVAMATAFGVGALLAVFILKQREARKSTTHKQATDEKNEKKTIKNMSTWMYSIEKDEDYSISGT